MLYRTTTCPYCGHVLEHRAVTAKELIGPPLAKCPSCGNTYATGMKHWADMNGYDKTSYVLRAIALFPKTILMYTIGSVFLPGIVLYWLIDRARLGEFIESHIGILVGYTVLMAILWTVLYVRADVLRIKGKWHEQEEPTSEH